MNYLLPLIFSFVSLPVMAQAPSKPAEHQDPFQSQDMRLFEHITFPQADFRNPLDIPMSLAANFGELRPNHYHMGLDIRTQHKVNLPVHAAADGYVARVQIEPAGFGQAIYIRHPNGYTTVYGHLNAFFPGLAAYIHQQQYRQQSWQVDLTLPPDLFPVKKGDFIAYSGNTGGSQGPHLHFEIRQTAGDVNLNPLLFNLPVADDVAPTILRLAWYDRTRGIYEQSPHILPVRRSVAPRLAPDPASTAKENWTIGSGVLTVPTNRISFALSAFDTQNGSANPNGIYEARLFFDDVPVIEFRMNAISYDDTRNINAHIDYKTRETGGPFLQQLFFLSGYPAPSIYQSVVPQPDAAGSRLIDPAGDIPSNPATKGSASIIDRAIARSLPVDGVLHLDDSYVHSIVIDVLDTYGNLSKLSFRVQYRPQPTAITATSVNVAGSYTVAAGTPAPTAGKKFYSGMIDGLETPDCAFYLGEKSLYDSVFIGMAETGYPGSGLSLPDGMSAVHTIGAPWIPLLDPILVRLRLIVASAQPAPAMDSIDFSEARTDTDRIVMVCFDGNQKDVRRPEWRSGWASAHFREFGNFQLVRDTIPPVIVPIGALEGADLSHATRIAFNIKDNLGALRNFRAELDGAWLCFTNDKGLAYIYTFDEHCPPGAHTLRVTVEDVAGNRTVREYHFNR